jgi:hypothetical protein
MASVTGEATNIWTLFDSLIGHDSIPNQISVATDNISGNIDILEVSINQNSIRKTKTRQLSSSEVGTSSIYLIQDGIRQISFNQTTPEQVSGIQLSFSEDSTFQTRFPQNGSSKIGSSEIGISKIGTSEVGSTQVNSLQIQPFEVNPSKLLMLSIEASTSKIALSSIISNHQSSPVIIQPLHQAIHLAIAGSDYNATNGKVTFAAGETSKIEPSYRLRVIVLSS